MPGAARIAHSQLELVWRRIKRPYPVALWTGEDAVAPSRLCKMGAK